MVLEILKKCLTLRRKDANRFDEISDELNSPCSFFFFCGVKMYVHSFIFDDGDGDEKDINFHR